MGRFMAGDKVLQERACQVSGSIIGRGQQSLERREQGILNWVLRSVRGAVAWLVGSWLVGSWLVGSWLVGSCASAGGGPENILIVVNAQSEGSKTIANHYIQLRGVSASHVLYINWKGGIEVCKGEKFRQRLLQPIIQAIDERKLGLQTDYVVYSSDFPWRIDLREDFAEAEKPATVRPIASLTGATYLWPYIQLKHDGFLLRNANWYVPGSQEKNLSRCQELGNFTTRAFRANYHWTRTGGHTQDVKQGQRYFLSVMLGVTTGRGNTVDEVLSYLYRSVKADATHPDGTFYFMQRKGVRSSTRDACFPAAVKRLAALGVGAQLLQGDIPRGRHDILGIVSGTANFDLDRAHDTLLPGAICDNLTSLGGVMLSDIGQTPLTSFLRHGAAGACGTVAEPYAIQAKFPLASLDEHYVRGSSLAEAFYQSIPSPYQLLIVGDPLCQPWARPPIIKVDGLQAGDTVEGTVTLVPKASSLWQGKIRFFELHIDGVMYTRLGPGKKIEVDTTKLVDGHHEFQIVGVAPGSIESQGRVNLPIEVRNHDGKLEFSIFPESVVAAAASLRLVAFQPGAENIEFMQNNRVVGRIDGNQGEIEIAAALLGRGPTTIQAKSGGEKPVVSRPIPIRVD
jgi:uncharacterized protein (TIGR03790 family)